MLTGLLMTLSLTGCVGTMSNHKVTLTQVSSKKPAIVNTYDYSGQKVDQIKTSKIEISQDKNVYSMINVKYGQNAMKHSSSALIGYAGLTNFANDYQDLKQRQIRLNPANSDMNKTLPTAGDIYHVFKYKWPTSGTVVEVKTQSGCLIGLFVGHVASVTDFGDGDNANAIIKLDNRKIFVYDASYTLYPVSTAKSMWQNNKASRVSQQAPIKTHDGTAIASDNKKSK